PCRSRVFSGQIRRNRYNARTRSLNGFIRSLGSGCVTLVTRFQSASKKSVLVTKNRSPEKTMADSRLDGQETNTGFIRGLGLLDSTMIVAGSMIGSGIFIVSGGISKQVGAPGWLLVVWIVTGLLTLMGALCYGELAAMMPKAGGQYVYLREAFSPLWGFLYGWTLFLVIQTGTIAAVAVGFARYLGVLVPSIGEDKYLIPPIHLVGDYAISLSTAQLVGVLLIVLLTFMNTRGLKLGKLVQNTFTTAKLAALFGLILLGIVVGLIWHSDVARANFG